jgi:hypothetical protein
LIIITPIANANYSSINIYSTDAKQIKLEFLDLENNFTGAEKISRQLQIIKNVGLISNSSFNFFIKIVGSLNQSGVLSRCFDKKAFFVGPTIISHFTLNNRIQAILPIRKPLFYFPFLQTENISGVAGILPYYLGKSNNTSYLTCVSYLYKESFDANYTSLRELMIPTIGFSIAFFDNLTSEVLFEYNLDYCNLFFVNGS